jgi:hypothetical protein
MLDALTQHVILLRTRSGIRRLQPSLAAPVDCTLFFGSAYDAAHIATAGRRAWSAAGGGRADLGGVAGVHDAAEPPGVVILNACYSDARAESLHSLAESLSQSSITCVGMWVGIVRNAAPTGRAIDANRAGAGAAG